MKAMFFTFYLSFTIGSEYSYFITSWMTVSDYGIIAKFHELWIRHKKNWQIFILHFFCLKIKFWQNSNRCSFSYNTPNIPKNLMFLAEVGYWMFFILTHSLGMRLEIILDISSVSYFKNMIYGSLYIDTGHAFILTTYYA